MQNLQSSTLRLPLSTPWGLNTSIAGRAVVRGTLSFTSLTGNRLTGTANFRGRPLPINGTWNEYTNQIMFDTPYATFSGKLFIFDSAAIRVRHYILRGRFVMKPPSIQAGEQGDWIATTDTPLTGPVTGGGGLPPVGVFLTSEILHGTPRL
ncbi:hypothetical protein [Peribacillus sp. SCS-155]|uniref:hypothetical protein n=1 Tax=Peribacillus sedimenti TaxID=3115297 RepID=UPI0039057635